MVTNPGVKRKSSEQMKNPSVSERRSGVSEEKPGSVDIAQQKALTKGGQGKTVLPEVDLKVGKTILDDSPVEGEHYRAVSPVVGRKP